jgi:NAD(P)-dependent dehydrogenase (short-subunit alcohol dehydrogenase family)/uncharacterized OB-fold protein
MTEPYVKPKRKNPILRTRTPKLPPAMRSRVTLGLTAAAAEGRFELQVCNVCSTVQYPPREACHSCLSDDLPWREQNGMGELIAETTLHHSLENYFRERVPWRSGIVKLDVGPTLVVHVHGDCDRASSRVRVEAKLDRSGHAVLIALPEKDTPNMSDDPQLREFTCDPKFRKVFVTDGKSPVGQAVVKAVIAAGSDLVWVGYAEPWKKIPGFDELKELPEVTLIPLDLTNPDQVEKTAGMIGPKVDILINTAEYHRNYSVAARKGTENARAEMDVNYFGLMRLSQSFGPVMAARAADTESSAVAWVNLLSIYALANFPEQGTFSASKAAAFSLSQNMRAEFLHAGIRVINAFPGPIDDEWNQDLLPPKVAPEALARAMVQALKDGVEDIYPGDIAKDWLARWRDNPKVLERELATG